MDEHELRRKAELAELFLDASRRLGQSAEPDAVYDCFHELLTDVVPHDGVVVSSYDEADGLIRCEYAWVEGNRVDPATLPPLRLNREGGGMQSRVIVSGEPLLVNDVPDKVRRDDGTYYNVDRSGRVRKLPESGPAGTQAAMMVPVKYEGRVVGVVQLMSDRHEYSAADLELFEGLVGQMAAAVRTLRLQKERGRLEAAEAAARAVAAEREQAAHVLDAVGVGIFLVDREGVVRLWNRAAEAATGVPAERVSGRRMTDAFAAWEELGARIPITDDGDAARPVALPFTVGGRELWLSFVAVRSVDGVVYAFRDVTDERRLDQAKSDFIATISHELRTPMAAVYGAAMTLTRGDIALTGDDRNQLIEMIATQAARLGQITEEVLLTNQLDRGVVQLEREPVEVGEVVRAAVEVMRPHVSPPTTLDVELGRETVQARGDGDRIQQVLVNLLDNAIKYGRGAPVGVRAESDDGVVRICVSDQGPGIPPSEQEWIFEKFYRGDPNLTRSPGGTGLGLYISRELVRRMGGRLDVRSERGAGATFVVELPRA